MEQVGSYTVQILSVIAGTVIFLLLFSHYHGSHREDAARYYVKPPEALNATHQTSSSDSLTTDVGSRFNWGMLCVVANQPM